jgi:hypothetical protein
MMYDEMLTLEGISKEPFIIEHIMWDIEPKDLMESRHIKTGTGNEVRPAIKGYVFYIDTTDKKPSLYLLRHTAADFAETLAHIKEIPAELLAEAVEENRARVYFNMYPINEKVAAWLRKELAIAP